MKKTVLMLLMTICLVAYVSGNLFAQIVDPFGEIAEQLNRDSVIAAEKKAAQIALDLQKSNEVKDKKKQLIAEANDQYARIKIEIDSLRSWYTVNQMPIKAMLTDIVALKDSMVSMKKFFQSQVEKKRAKVISEGLTKNIIQLEKDISLLQKATNIFDENILLLTNNIASFKTDLIEPFSTGQSVDELNNVSAKLQSKVKLYTESVTKTNTTIAELNSSSVQRNF